MTKFEKDALYTLLTMAEKEFKNGELSSEFPLSEEKKQEIIRAIRLVETATDIFLK